jgi:16S rRNA (guanine527-N7)-methyltransferase
MSSNEEVPEQPDPAAQPELAESELPADPQAPLPERAELRAALGEAFANEAASPELLERFADHARHLLETNRSINLTAICQPGEVAAKHYLDCWHLTRAVPLFGRRVFDMGTGAGFPGIVLAMAEHEAQFVLCDSTKKKVEFVEGCIQRFELRHAKAVWSRAEDWLAKERVDIVVARAVSSVRENVRVLRKVRHSFKDLVLMKGPSWSRESRAAEREAERLGFRLEAVHEYKLPAEQGARAILVYRAPGGQG